MKRIQKAPQELLAQIDAAVQFISNHTALVPETGLILGTGLGDLARKIKTEAAIPYRDIPHFPDSTAESHSGRLVLGHLAGKTVIAMEGRFHFYEGYSLEQVTFPVRVAKLLGAKSLVVSNAAGGLNPGYRKGELVLIEDHINFMGDNPLIGPNDERLGPRFPDMSEPYSARLAGHVEEAARKTGIPLRRGTYIAVTGPCLETRAEYRMMRSLGADLVGMSTVPEVITAVHMGMEVLGISVVTDLCDPDHLEPVDIKEIIRVAQSAGPKLDRLLESAMSKF